MGEKIIDLYNHRARKKYSMNGNDNSKFFVNSIEPNHVKENKGRSDKFIDQDHLIWEDEVINSIPVDSFLPYLLNAPDKEMPPKEGGEPMDEGYKKVIDRLDQDLRDFKREISERDERIQRELLAREDRFRQEASEREVRSRQDAKEREERILNALKDNSERLESDMKDVKESVKRSEERIDTSTKHIQALVTTNKWGNYATFIGVLAILISIVTCVVSVWVSND